MKKFLMVVMTIVFIVLLAGCTNVEKAYITGFYNAETNEYCIKNERGIDYEELVVHLKVENENGYEKELEYDIGTLKADEEYVIDLSEVSEISEVYLYKYYYYKSIMPLIILISIGVAAIIIIGLL